MNDAGWKVVAVGTANAGKSSLLSALADQRELFASGERPYLTSNFQNYRLGKLHLIDTPAFRGEARDEELAEWVNRRADTILWCHSLRQGELHADELAALSRLLRHQGTSAKLRLVLTRADDLASAETVFTVSDTIAKQMKTVFGLETAPHTVGVSLYWRAVEIMDRQRQRAKGRWLGLCRPCTWRRLHRKFDERQRESGIPGLRELLHELAESHDEQKKQQ
ncbi:MAG: GTPase domain-containing protein [Gemmataceae bacterium]|nr:GTPase domain-containing protein [Gemmataceae bacterium]